MQNTRLNNLVTALGRQVGSWIFNPWRRLSIITISLLFGFFLGTAVATTAGQSANLDIVAAGILVALCEVADRIYYRRREGRRFWVESLNALKIGLTYSLFIEAFKLGS
ncbi:MAG: DUF565 domain-containing protein [Tatlockia sp.]|jgi:hypothetical protein|nr:DUF565 domain-containing protein [Tatlockia sp.]